MNTKVLLVNEEVRILQTLSRHLTNRGFSVALANTGDQALALIQQSDFDVAVIDLLMTGSDGIAILQQIKHFMPLTEVIVLTSTFTVDAAIKGMRLGAFDYVLKDADPAELVRKISSARQRKNRQETKIKLAENEYINVT